MDAVKNWMDYQPKKENLLLMLHEIQRSHPEDHYISDTDIADVARYLGIPLSEVDGVATFYSMYSRKPRGRYVIRLCDSLSCRICGSLDVYYHLQSLLGIRDGQTTGDGLFTLEIVNCLGNCGEAPNILINETLYSGLAVGDVDTVITTCYQEAAQ